MEYSPVVVFVYNRPEHTEKCLAHLSKADLANQSNVYIFCDGPKNAEALKSVRETRAIVNKFKNNFKGFIVFESDKNKGLAKSIIGGVTEIVNRHGKVIVLEDDLLVNKDFLAYMNYYLDLYNNEERVFHISAFQKDCWMQFFMPSVFITRYMNCSGWATWADKWNKLELNLDRINNHLKGIENLKKFNYSKLRNEKQLLLNNNGLKTWAIFWYATIQINNGYCINSNFSLLTNIGDDGSGSNMGLSTENKVTNLLKKFKRVKKIGKIKESKLAYIFIQQAYSQKSKLSLNSIKSLIFHGSTILRKYICQIR